MALLYTPTSIGTGFNVTKINNNFTSIQSALADGLSRSGAGSNAMSVDIDMGTNDILNGGIANFADIVVGGTSVAAQAAAAAASAAAALASETAAATSETNAATSETNAAASAAAASTSETNAAASAAAASTSETNAAASQSAAAASASAASTSETNAAASAAAASTSASNAATSETNAASSASAASTSASNASTSETNAAASASAASTSETNAASSENMAYLWANELEDVVVSGGEYSAFHWAQKASASGELVKVSSNDLSADYLLNQLAIANGLALTELNDGGNEQVQIGVGTHLEVGGGANLNVINAYKADSAACSAIFQNLTTGNTATDGFKIGINSSEQAQLWNYENTDTIFAVNNLSLMILHPNGRLDLGPNNINVNTINANIGGSGANYIGFTNDTTGHTSADGSTVGIDANEHLIVWNKEATDVRIGTTNQERVTIQAGGNVSIGTTTDANKLQVHGGGDSYIGITNTDTGSTSADGAKIGITATENLRIDIQETNKEIEFATQGSVDWSMAANGGMYSITATGGSQGAETMNTKGFFVNGKRTPTLLGNYTGTAASSLDLASIFSSNTAYKTFKVTGWITANTGAATIRSRVSTNGSTFVTGSNYGYTVRVWRSNGTATNAQANPSAATTMEMCDGTGLSTGSDNYSFDITWNGPASTSVITGWHGTANYILSGGTVSNIAYIGGTYDATTAVTGFQIYPSTGTFDYDISVWGIA